MAQNKIPLHTRLAGTGFSAGVQRFLFIAALVASLLFVVLSVGLDVKNSQTANLTYMPFLFLALALLTALAFEFVNGFHDTANAVATVIYTHSLRPTPAILWSGLFNFLGVLLSSGAVAYGIVSLLPVDLILQLSTGSGFAMIFALLIAAMMWNLGTWYLGLPASSSHTLIGSIMGVGIMHATLNGQNGFTGVNWDQAIKAGYALLLSPLVGFFGAGILLFVMQRLVRRPELYRAPGSNQPPPLGIRALLILTCSGISFAHGSNDGQKGMGLIMLILIGTVPAAYALNHKLPANYQQEFKVASQAAQGVIAEKASGEPRAGNQQAVLMQYVKDHHLVPSVYQALNGQMQQVAMLAANVSQDHKQPAAVVENIRNAMYLTSEVVGLMLRDKSANFTAAEQQALHNYKAILDRAIKFIPLWVKITVALALGLGTMVGWKRIVVTVGEKIGKQHLTYAQGASAELMAAATIFAADRFGLPVSTTHVLSSGIAGAMAESGAGVQWKTLRNIGLAWVLTLPCAMLLSAALYFLFVRII